MLRVRRTDNIYFTPDKYIVFVIMEYRAFGYDQFSPLDYTIIDLLLAGF